jgi:drug/metabolite transporter (DMT)-like permease
MDRTRLRADALLLLTALIWGLAFVAQRVAALSIGVFFFNFARFVIGGLVLWLVISARQRRAYRLDLDRPGWAAAGIAGLFLFLGSTLQQAGLLYTTASNAGFITGLYVVFVPILLAVVLRRRVSGLVWAASALAVVGLFLLSTGGALHLNRGDLLELAGAVMWAGHVLAVGWAVQRVSLLPFSLGQFVIAGGLCLIGGLLFESLPTAWPLEAWLPVLYVGIFSTGIGYTLQAAGQQHAPETDAAFILTLEAVFSAFFGYWLLAERLLPVQIAGSALILLAVLLAQRGARRQPEVTPPHGA